MLYVFHGSDIKTGVEKAKNLIHSLRTKKPDAAFEVFSAENWNVSKLESHIGGQGLFSSKYIVFLDRVTENIEAKETLSDFVESLGQSENIFILLEGKVNVDLKKKLEKYAEKIVVCDEKTVNSFKKNEFNIFSLADAIGNKEKIKAWSIYRRAIDLGLETESICGTMFWQVKSMVLAKTAKTVTESGLSPFVFSKAKRASGNYSKRELDAFLKKIIVAYHDGHRGMTDLELSLEKLILASV